MIWIGILEFCDSSPNNRDADIPKPQRLDEMLEIAKVLSKDMTFYEWICTVFMTRFIAAN